MLKRREFMIGTAGIVGMAVPALSRGAAAPCPPPALSIDGASPASSSCVPVAVPSYIASMAPYQVRALTGTYSPTNGGESMQSVTPSSGAFGNWLSGDPGVLQLPGVVDAWCGGAKPASGSKMYVHGGGHNDSANNGLYVYDYAGTDRPAGWTLAKISPVSAIVAGQNVAYSDGLPSASHTADTSCILNGNLYRITSIPYNPNGGFASDSWKFNLSTNTWTRLANAPSSNAAVFPHAGSGKILCVDRQTLYFGYYFYQTATNSFSAIKNVSVQWPDYFCLAYKPLTATTGLLLISGSGKSFSSVVDWNAETITQTSRSLGAVSQSQAPGCVYDSATDRFWMFGARSNPGLVDEVNPNTWQVTPHSLSGDGVSFGSSYQGTYSRFVFMESFRAIGFVPTASGPAFVMRLP